MKVTLLGFVMAGFFVVNTAGVPGAYAEYKASPWTEEKLYMEKSSRKLGFGILNTMLGWSNILFEPYRRGDLWEGFVTGLGKAVGQTGGGLLHIATFPIPVDVPLPEGGVSFETGQSS